MKKHKVMKVLKNVFKIIMTFLVFVFINSCGDETLPKPNGFLRLDYPEPKYIVAKTELPFTFEKNTLATDIINKRIQATNKSYGLNIDYPKLKGTIYLTFKEVKNRKDLFRYLQDAQNFTQKHAQKADEITEQVYDNKARKVYGMFYAVGGNAASQSQFYVTDSVKHFLTGSLYFNAKPNYDSILPAANYLERDIQHIMETVKWTE